MNLPGVKDLPVANKAVLLRTDYDVPLARAGSGESGERSWKVKDDSRITESLATIGHLLSNGARVIIISHLGRPDGKVVPELSLKPAADCLREKLKIKNEKRQFKIKNFSAFALAENLILLENLRFFPGEEKNDLGLSKQLALLGDFYVNDAFAVSHREHASIVGVPRFFPAPPAGGRAFGFDFLEEIEHLSPLQENSKRPVVVILGGVKKDKLGYVDKLIDWADWILIGGKLPQSINNQQSADWRISNPKIIVAKLNDKGKDITLESLNHFREIILKAGTIVWAGPMGKYEEPEFSQGTKLISKAVVNSGAYTVVGGGDTEAALTKLDLVNRIDYVSSGGGAMLEFLATGTLAGIKAIYYD